MRGLRLDDLVAASVPARIDEVGRLVAHHLLGLAARAGVAQHRGQPAVHLVEVVVADGAGSDNDLVVRMPVGRDQPRAHRVAVDLVVDVAVDAIVEVVALIDDRRGGQPAAGRGDASRLVGARDRVEIAGRALRGLLEVDVDAADLLVQVDELVGRDHAVVQRLQAVLHAEIVDRPLGEAARVLAVDVDGVVVDGRAHAGRVVDRMVFLVGREPRGERHHRIEAARAAAHRGDVAGLQVTRDRRALRIAVLARRVLREVQMQQARVVQLEDRRRGDVREHRGHDDAVEQARIVVAGLVALIGAARAAGADREERRAVVLDQPFLDHRDGLGRQQVVAVVAEGIERGAGHRVALAQVVVVQHRHRRALHVPAALATAAERIDDLAVPARGRRQRRRLGVLQRVVQDRGLVDRAVDRTGLDADDIRYGHARVVGGAGQVRRIRGDRCRQRLEAVGGRAVDVVHAAFDRAVLVERRAQLAAVRQREVLRRADVGLFVRAGEDGAGDRIVGQRQRGTRGAALDLQRVLAELQAADDAERFAVGGRREGVADIGAVEADLELVAGRAFAGAQPDQRIAARHALWRGRQHGRLDRGPVSQAQAGRVLRALRLQIAATAIIAAAAPGDHQGRHHRASPQGRPLPPSCCLPHRRLLFGRPRRHCLFHAPQRSGQRVCRLSRQLARRLRCNGRAIAGHYRCRRLSV